MLCSLLTPKTCFFSLWLRVRFSHVAERFINNLLNRNIFLLPSIYWKNSKTRAETPQTGTRGCCGLHGWGIVCTLPEYMLVFLPVRSYSYVWSNDNMQCTNSIADRNKTLFKRYKTRITGKNTYVYAYIHTYTYMGHCQEKTRAITKTNDRLAGNSNDNYAWYPSVLRSVLTSSTLNFNLFPCERT